MGAFDIWILVQMEATVKYHSDFASILTLSHETGQGKVSVGQFDWGGRLLNGNGGARSYAQAVW